ncbi:hypothetical protein F3Y22_tig00110556pilonHSYRG00578 [Hibiscus syriacus]|uniref:Helicase C-terminal domain-containing protein n=1 Tax=Hibiscus syriacus TaxID=106335 RepID=A0A6A3A988_HIBSY|nr:hypothetical protein F3Y22_tig00110556pilonHSYRG00578 [Hibiscus syriacus]
MSDVEVEEYRQRREITVEGRDVPKPATSHGRLAYSLSIHGDKSQAERDWVLPEFKAGKSPIMTATDVAARGLDVKDVRYVINYDFPGSLEDYVHCIGRTGRAGAKGTAYTFFTAANAIFAE